ncbi:DUF4124 domain-containing protein [Chitinibacter sp. S2-10]|uniref:DUF4124 domain-containing protein n=1 Tax=Chitinibacter sp. S2-10 TaxID=3373597 RepID=UPI0039778597
MYAKPFFALFLSCASMLCLADIYKYVDQDGNVTFTNTPIKGAIRIMSEPAPRRSTNTESENTTSVRPVAPRNPHVSAPSPNYFPKVDAATQRSRDSNRRQILNDELSSEQAALNTARKALQEADNNRSSEEKNNPKLYLDRISRLRETIVMHEKNTAALQAELSRMR